MGWISFRLLMDPVGLAREQTGMKPCKGATILAKMALLSHLAHCAFGGCRRWMKPYALWLATVKIVAAYGMENGQR